MRFQVYCPALLVWSEKKRQASMQHQKSALYPYACWVISVRTSPKSHHATPPIEKSKSAITSTSQTPADNKKSSLASPSPVPIITIITRATLPRRRAAPCRVRYKNPGTSCEHVYFVTPRSLTIIFLSFWLQGISWAQLKLGYELSRVSSIRNVYL